ncbi:cysteine synthase family protein [Pseudaminobacter sp. NGMCC 1.201702]|uniref:cysteine synthase family protein n=1 Tax=Pseudaminobacter sp. NGMCC 1.201702 TaxID=3391825 RepID=UPI0039F09ECB
MSSNTEYLRACESPRFAKLAPNLHAACFHLMKLQPARYIIERAAASGQLVPRGRIVETTSGTFGLALAMVAATFGYDLTLITASSLVGPSFIHRLEKLGVEVIVTNDIRGDGNQVGRLERLREVMAAHPQSYWPQQYHNPENALAYASFAEEIARSIGRVDYLVGCVGSGGSLCGTGGFLRHLFPTLQVVAVDTQGSVLFGQRARKRLLRGLGNSILPANLRHQIVDEVHWVGALPAFCETHALYRTHGIFMGPTSGAAVLVARWVSASHPEAVTLAILPDEGHRYLETVYNDDWLARVPGWPMRPPKNPVTLTRIQNTGETDWTRFLWRRRSLGKLAP